MQFKNWTVLDIHVSMLKESVERFHHIYMTDLPEAVQFPRPFA